MLPKMYIFLKQQDCSVEESVDVCAWRQLTHSPGVYFFTLLSKEAYVRGDTGSDSRVYITRSM